MSMYLSIGSTLQEMSSTHDVPARAKTAVAPNGERPGRVAYAALAFAGSSQSRV